MMEKKFRAWNEDHKEMIYFSLFDTDRAYHIEAECSLDESPIMQYTGLKDKNGKEIYEGDIITTGKGNYPIYYDNEKCQFKAKGYNIRSQDIPWDFTEEPYLIEKIGNIYMNPELLKGENNESNQNI